MTVLPRPGPRRSAYVGTGVACAPALHLTRTAAYGATGLLSVRVVLPGAALTPATLAGAWTGKGPFGLSSDRAFVFLVEAGLVAAGLIFVLGL